MRPISKLLLKCEANFNDIFFRPGQRIQVVQLRHELGVSLQDLRGLFDMHIFQVLATERRRDLARDRPVSVQLKRRQSSSARLDHPI